MAKESILSRVPLPAKVGIIVAALALIGVAYWVVFYGDVAQKITAEVRREDKLKADLAEAKKAESAYQKDLAELHEREPTERSERPGHPPRPRLGEQSMQRPAGEQAEHDRRDEQHAVADAGRASEPKQRADGEQREREAERGNADGVLKAHRGTPSVW